MNFLADELDGVFLGEKGYVYTFGGSDFFEDSLGAATVVPVVAAISTTALSAFAAAIAVVSAIVASASAPVTATVVIAAFAAAGFVFALGALVGFPGWGVGFCPCP